jgi:hypothetical protein
MYFKEDIRILMKILKNTRVNVAYSVDNTIKTNCKINRQYDKYNNSGVYRLKC